LAEAAAARGSRVIIADPLHKSHSQYAMPEEAAYREFMAVASDPGREHPVLLIAPQDISTAILRDLRKYAAWVVVTCETRDGYCAADMPPDGFSLLWYGGRLTATTHGIAGLLDVALSDIP
jgi:hypothetical protein